MSRTKKTATPQLTVLASEVQEAMLAGKRFQGAYRSMKAAESVRETALDALFRKMGFSGLDEVKALSPKKLRALIVKRLGKVFEFESAEPGFALLKTWEGKSPSWKAEVIARLGAEIAAQIEQAAAPRYSYTLIEPVVDAGPNVIAIPAGGR
jgi:hypothetical protein